jgi:hypothetical protein
MGEQHLDAFAVAARLLENFGVNECTGGIASVFMDAARDFALRRLWAAFGFQRARPTIRAMTMGYPINGGSLLKTVRAKKSADPPAGNGTMICN